MGTNTKILQKGGYMTNFQIKLVGIITMLIDHIGYLVHFNIVDDAVLWYNPWAIYLRMIGRIAFPIFVFLAAEGADKTKDRVKYIKRLWVFALISQVPFALFLQYPLFYRINVFATLALGVTLIHLYEKINFRKISKLAIALVVVFGIMIFSDVFRLDYGGIGVIFVLAIYLTKKLYPNNVYAVAFTVLVAMFITYNYSDFLIASLISLIPIMLYNNEIGHKKYAKWLFYGFYPVHMLVLTFVRMLII